MQGLRQFGMAVVIGLVSLGLVVGGLSLSMSESFTRPLASATANPPTPLAFLTATHTSNAPQLPTALPTFTNTPLPPAACIPPAGWMGILVMAGDTLDGLAARYGTTPDALIQANCLLSASLAAGSTLFVPNTSAAANTPIPCGVPRYWVRYTVQPGDTLYRIAVMYNTSVVMLQQANCLGASTAIQSGQLLWVPNVTPRTAVPTPTPGITLIPDFFTPTPEATITPFPTDPLTETPPPPPTETPEPTLTAAPTDPPTSEPLPSPTITAFP
ncbi:MAG: LysM peptidoglycan-binding domain-containing protein [Chloroflexota bacterium]